MHHQLDSLAYTNRLRSLPPEHKLGFAIALFMLGYLAPPYIQLLITAWLALWVIGYARIPWGIYLKLLSIPMGFWLMSIPALVVGVSFVDTIAEVGPDAIWGIRISRVSFYVSQQGLDQAQTILTRAIALSSCLYFMVLTVPFVDIVRVLRHVGCPSLVTELLALMYRFIFVLAETAVELVTAQQSRLGYYTWRSRFRSVSLVISQLLRRTLENYRQIALGLTSRGFNGELRVWHARRYKLNWRYAGEAIGGCCVLVILVGWHYAHGI